MSIQLGNIHQSQSLFLNFSFTGKLIKVLKDPQPRVRAASADLCLYDNTIAVPRWDDSVLIYELQGDDWRKQ